MRQEAVCDRPPAGLGGASCAVLYPEARQLSNYRPVLWRAMQNRHVAADAPNLLSLGILTAPKQHSGQVVSAAPASARHAWSLASGQVFPPAAGCLDLLAVVQSRDG